MGFHRTADLRSRHGIRTRIRYRPWAVVAVCCVLLPVLGWIGWHSAGDLLTRHASAATGCGAGNITIDVAVTPSIVGTLQQAADSWADTHPVVAGHCARAEIHGLDSQAVLDGLTTGWDRARLGPQPTAWLPESTLWANELSARNRALIGSVGDSVGRSPVLLALPKAGGMALQTGDAFQWSQLPSLTSSSVAWSRYGQPDWHNLRIAFPDLNRNPASAMAVQSAIAGASPAAIGPVTRKLLATQPVRDLVAQLASSRVPDAPESTRAALIELGRVTGMGSARFQAVPVFEIDLYRRNLGLDGAYPPASPLIGVPAGGPNPTADFPFLTLTGAAADPHPAAARPADPGQADVLDDAGRQFGDFLRTPAERHELALAGLREPGSQDHPNPSPGVRWGATTDNLIPADASTTEQISAAWSDASAGGQVVTVLVDVSRSMALNGGDGTSRIDWVRSALTGQIDRSVAESLGLWEFSRALDGALPYRQLAPTRPVREQQTALRAAVDTLQPVSATNTYSSVLAVYRYAMAHYQSGKPNEVVLITDGPNDGDYTLDSLLAELSSLRDSDRPLPIGVIAVGSDPDRTALGALAKATGGRVSVAPDGRSIEPALAQLLATAH